MATTSLLTTVKSFFKNENWVFEEVENQTILRMFFQGKNGEWLCLAEVKEELELFIFYSVSSTKAPEGCRESLTSLLMGINSDLAIGGFELDFQDGDIRFRSSISAKGTSLDETLIKNLVYANVLTMDKYLPKINRLIEGRTAMSQWFNRIHR